jgi:hypothetical protein
MTTRTKQRQGFSSEGRIVLLEQDADHFEAMLESQQKTLQRIFISTSSAAIMLFIDIVIRIAF